MVWGRRLGSGLVVASAVMAGGVAGQAPAATWQFQPGVTAETTYTDNVRGVSEGAESDLLYVVRPGFRLRGTGARLKLNLNTSLGYEDYLSTDGLGGWNLNVLGAAQAELLEDIVFFDTSTSYRRRPIDRTGAVSAVDRDLGRNQTEVFTVEASPFVRLRLRNIAVSETRLRVGSTMYNVLEQNDDPGANSTSDAIVWSVAQTVSSGSRFTRLSWRLGASHSVTERDEEDGNAANGSDRFERSNVGVSAQYAIYRWLAATGKVGIDRIDSGRTFGDDLDGPYYLFGPRFTGSRTTFYFAAGRRYDNPSYEGEARYRLSSALEFRGFYSETVTTEQERSLRPFDFVGVDAEGNLIDTRTGLPLDPSDPAFDLSDFDNAFRQRTLRFGLNGTRLRNTYRLDGFLSRRDSGDTDREQTVTGFSGSFTRALSPRLRLGINASLRNSEDEDSEQTTMQLGSSLSYSLSETLTTTLSVQHLDRDSEDNRNDLSENTVTVSVRKSF
jgi:uncharacterized protein (PEP-CTERM system associated)